ncbi:MAG: NTP transferase domain-containing protein [Verrucomicrobiota bacterium]
MKTPLLGLVLAGGKSSRMGRDKAELRYHDAETQLERSVRLLQPFCEEVFVSLSQGDERKLPFKASPLYDSLPKIRGPLCGILSAHLEEPNSDWLILACDLPNLEESSLSKLVETFYKNTHPIPVCYRSHNNGLPEPLCTIYPASVCESFLQEVQAKGTSSPRDLLKNTKIAMIDPIDSHSLDNINTPEEYLAFCERK